MRNRGVFVKELTIDDIREMYTVREAIEKASAEILLAAGHSQIDRTWQSLKEIVAEMSKQEPSDWQEIARLDMQFHATLVAGTRNSRLMRIYDTLAAETRMCIHNLRVSYPRVDVLVQEHQEIVDKLGLRDSEGLQQAISDHMRKAVDDLNATQDRVEPL
jgi:DNA-binding GntR family transcriptional regulator